MKAGLANVLGGDAPTATTTNAAQDREPSFGEKRKEEKQNQTRKRIRKKLIWQSCEKRHTNTTHALYHHNSQFC